MEVYILPTSRGETLAEEMIAGLPLPPSNLIPLFTSAAVIAFVSYHTNAEHVGPSTDKDNPVEAAFLWILDHWDHYISLAQELNTFTEQLGQDNGAKEKSN